jgi:hypothetical protein
MGSVTLHAAELVSISLVLGSSATYCESLVVLVSLRFVVAVGWLYYACFEERLWLMCVKRFCEKLPWYTCTELFRFGCEGVDITFTRWFRLGFTTIFFLLFSVVVSATLF